MDDCGSDGVWFYFALEHSLEGRFQYLELGIQRILHVLEKIAQVPMRLRIRCDDFMSFFPHCCAFFHLIAMLFFDDIASPSTSPDPYARDELDKQ